MSITTAIIKCIPIQLIERYIRFKSRNPQNFEKFVMKIAPELLEQIGQRKTLYLFRKAAREIPFYREFLARQGINATDIKTIDDFKKNIPVITKESYLHTAPDIKALCFNGEVSDASVLFESSGYTGTPTVWPKSRQEEQQEKNYFTIGVDVLFGTHKKKTLFINTFALGSWVTGVELARISDVYCTVINSGPDETEVCRILEKFKADFAQFIIAGYPPFIKNLVENGAAKIQWKNFPANFLVGAEGMPEELRDYIYDTCGDQTIVISGYGASDIGITGINETHESIKIRRLSRKYPALMHELFGDTSTLPMLFQYDPTTYFIQRNSSGELEFTTINSSTIMPLIRYNLKDSGGVISHAAMKKIISHYAPDMAFTFPFPFVYVYGRSDGTLKFYGSLIYPTTINSALYADKKLLAKTTNHFKTSIITDTRHLPYICVELQLHNAVRADKKLQGAFERIIQKSLLATLDDLRPKEKYFKKYYPHGFVKVTLYPFEKFPIEKSIKIHYQ